MLPRELEGCPDLPLETDQEIAGLTKELRAWPNITKVALYATPARAKRLLGRLVRGGFASSRFEVRSSVAAKYAFVEAVEWRGLRLDLAPSP
jgi:hypothetical protein